MRSNWLPLIVVCSALTALSATAFAGFEPLFKVTKITGNCSLQRPTEKAFSPAKTSKAYPYGTKIKTGKGASLVISFSKGNICRILANANVSVDEDSQNKKLKVIRINTGEIEVNLLEDFHKNGDQLNVETATATCTAIGCKFRVASKTEDALQVVIVRVIEGAVRVFGENFDAKKLGDSDWLSLLSPSDRSFLRLKTMKGKFDITIKDKDMQDKAIPTVEGTVLKIWQRYVPESKQRVVTVVLTDPDGTLVETHTVTYDAGVPSPFNGNVGGQGVGKGNPEPGNRVNPVPEQKKPVPELNVDIDPAKDPTPTGNR